MAREELESIDLHGQLLNQLPEAVVICYVGQLFILVIVSCCWRWRPQRGLYLGLWTRLDAQRHSFSVLCDDTADFYAALGRNASEKERASLPQIP